MPKAETSTKLVYSKTALVKLVISVSHSFAAVLLCESRLT